MYVTSKFACGLAVFVLLFAGPNAFGQSKKWEVKRTNAVMWTPVDVDRQDTLNGPLGNEGAPDVSRVTFIRRESGGSKLKYRIRDANGKVWVAKIHEGESRAEVAANRLLSGIGYKTETVYFVPRITIPGKGTFSNVRLEARPENVERKGRWKWNKNPFSGTNELQGLKLMMAFLANWDMKDSNNVILRENGVDYYVVSDVGTAFGRTGKVGFPLLNMIGRSRNNPADYSKVKFVKGTRKGRIRVEFNGKNRGQMKNITVSQARWLTSKLSQLSDEQIRDAFRAAHYTPSQVEALTQAVKRRIRELQSATGEERIGMR